MPRQATALGWRGASAEAPEYLNGVVSRPRCAPATTAACFGLYAAMFDAALVGPSSVRLTPLSLDVMFCGISPTSSSDSLEVCPRAAPTSVLPDSLASRHSTPPSSSTRIGRIPIPPGRLRSSSAAPHASRLMTRGSALTRESCSCWSPRRSTPGMAAVPEGWTYKVLYVAPDLLSEWAEQDAPAPRGAQWVVFRDRALRTQLLDAHRALVDGDGLAVEVAVLGAVDQLRPHLRPGPPAPRGGNEHGRCAELARTWPNGGPIGFRSPSSRRWRDSAASNWFAAFAPTPECHRMPSRSICELVGRDGCWLRGRRRPRSRRRAVSLTRPI